jgi:flagellar secretion chaperone FliS
MSAQAFARAYQAQSILTASPGQLVLLLYDGALRFIAQARSGIAEPEGTAGRIERINAAILRAEAIIAELRANLDMARGGEIASNLDRLYDYHLRRLFEANMRKQDEPLAEVEHLLGELREGWVEMLHQRESQVA